MRPDDRAIGAVASATAFPYPYVTEKWGEMTEGHYLVLLTSACCSLRVAERENNINMHNYSVCGLETGAETTVVHLDGPKLGSIVGSFPVLDIKGSDRVQANDSRLSSVAAGERPAGPVLLRILARSDGTLRGKPAPHQVWQHQRPAAGSYPGALAAQLALWL